VGSDGLSQVLLRDVHLRRRQPEQSSPCGTGQEPLPSALTPTRAAIDGGQDLRGDRPGRDRDEAGRPARVRQDREGQNVTGPRAAGRDGVGGGPQVRNGPPDVVEASTP
jgi:hypothetical protein